MSWDSACSSTPGTSKFQGVTADISLPEAKDEAFRDKDSLHKAKTKKKRKEAKNDAMSLKEQACQIMAMIVIAWVVATYGFKSVEWVKQQLRPFCDSNSSGEEISDDCFPCPNHGFCQNGRLECFPGYKRVRRLCVEDTEMDRIAGKLRLQLKSQLCRHTARAICDGASGAVWLTNKDAQKQMKQEGLQERFKLDEKSWHLVWEKIAGSNEDGLVTQNEFSGDREFRCPPGLIQRYKSLTCRFWEWIVAQSVILVITSPVIILLASTISKCVTRKRRRERAEQVYLQVCEELEAKALEARDVPGGESWVVVSRLRDHVLLPRERKWTPLWRQVESLVKEDSRIDLYQKKVKGEMKVVWEWQVEGALRTPARQKNKFNQGASSAQERSDSPHQS